MRSVTVPSAGSDALPDPPVADRASTVLAPSSWEHSTIPAPARVEEDAIDRLRRVEMQLEGLRGILAPQAAAPPLVDPAGRGAPGCALPPSPHRSIGVEHEIHRTFRTAAANEDSENARNVLHGFLAQHSPMLSQDVVGRTFLVETHIAIGALRRELDGVAPTAMHEVEGAGLRDARGEVLLREGGPAEAGAGVAGTGAPPDMLVKLPDVQPPQRLSELGSRPLLTRDDVEDVDHVSYDSRESDVHYMPLSSGSRQLEASIGAAGGASDSELSQACLVVPTRLDSRAGSSPECSVASRSDEIFETSPWEGMLFRADQQGGAESLEGDADGFRDIGVLTMEDGTAQVGSDDPQYFTTHDSASKAHKGLRPTLSATPRRADHGGQPILFDGEESDDAAGDMMEGHRGPTRDEVEDSDTEGEERAHREHASDEADAPERHTFDLSTGVFALEEALNGDGEAETELLKVMRMLAHLPNGVEDDLGNAGGDRQLEEALDSLEATLQIAANSPAVRAGAAGSSRVDEDRRNGPRNAGLSTPPCFLALDEAHRQAIQEAFERQQVEDETAKMPDDRDSGEADEPDAHPVGAGAAPAPDLDSLRSRMKTASQDMRPDVVEEMLRGLEKHVSSIGSAQQPLEVELDLGFDAEEGPRAKEDQLLQDAFSKQLAGTAPRAAVEDARRRRGRNQAKTGPKDRSAPIAAPDRSMALDATDARTRAALIAAAPPPAAASRHSTSTVPVQKRRPRRKARTREKAEDAGHGAPAGTRAPVDRTPPSRQSSSWGSLPRGAAVGIVSGGALEASEPTGSPGGAPEGFWVRNGADLAALERGLQMYPREALPWLGSTTPGS